MSRVVASWSLVLLVLGCGRPHEIVPDDSGVVAPLDAGAALDASLIADAGVAPSITLVIAANPNSVLSAVATVFWTGSISALHVEYSTDAGVIAETPIRDVRGLASPQVLPVLGLRDSTSYAFDAVAAEPDGGVLTSPPAQLTTGELPREVPRFFVDITGTGAPAPGYTLLAIEPPLNITPYYVTAVDLTGYPVWYIAATPTLAGDVQQQPDGTFTLGLLNSSVTIPGIDDTIVQYFQYDGLGNLIRIWNALDVPDANPPITVLGTGEHEFRLMSNGDGLLFGFEEVNGQDLTAFGGKANASIIGNVLERVTNSGVVTFAWDGLKNVPISGLDPACANMNAAVVDFPHANAADLMSDGNYLVSLRAASQVLKIDSTTGETVWRLGGRDGQFTFPSDPLGGFSCQHGARELPNGDIILFDDGDGHNPQQSRAAEYALDITAMTATLVWSQEDSPPEYVSIMGYAQRLSTGNTLVAYGTKVNVQEVDANSNLVWVLVDPGESFGIYRAYRLSSLYGPDGL